MRNKMGVKKAKWVENLSSKEKQNGLKKRKFGQGLRVLNL